MSEAPGIYDLGYQRYTGERLGRRAAIWALYGESLRGAFGLGRRPQAKIAPAVLIFVALLPAVGQLAIGAIVSGVQDIIEHHDYFNVIKFLLALYCAVVAPDIMGRDQRSHTLALYFSRAVSRLDYALGKYLALFTAILVITLLPQAILFLGNALATNDFGSYLDEDADKAGPIVLTAVMGAALIAAIGGAVAAAAARRAYATAGIIVAFMLTFAFAALMVEAIHTEETRYAVFVSPFDLIEGFTFWIFDVAPEGGSSVRQAGFDLGYYAAVSLGVTAAGALLIARRFLRIQA